MGWYLLLHNNWCEILHQLI